jgi:phage recombination protein Bet
MSTQIVKSPAKAEQPKTSALAVMASRLNVELSKLLQTLKSTVFKNATDDELLALVVVANHYQLDPLLKEIYAFPAKGGGIVPIVSMDGWNKMLIRQESFDGIDFDFTETEDGKPVTCTATIYIKGRSRPVKITEYFAECHRNTDPWNNMPHRMLRNRTLCQASRMAFGFSGVNIEDEIIDVAATVVSSEPIRQAVITAPSGQSSVLPTEAKDPVLEFSELCGANGISFEAVQKWGVETGNIDDAGSLGGFCDIPKSTAARLLKAKTGLVTGLKGVQELVGKGAA